MGRFLRHDHRKPKIQELVGESSCSILFAPSSTEVQVQYTLTHSFEYITVRADWRVQEGKEVEGSRL